MSEPLLAAAGIVKGYPSGERRIEVLKGLDLEIAPGEAVAVVGDSGVGKSTLLHILGGLDRPDAGSLRFRGGAVSFDDGPAIALFRNRQVGFVFQMHYLLPEFSALENVLMPFRIGRRAGGAEDAAISVLGRLGLKERLHHHPGALSGGEQQRVAIARAVAPGPALILADEPTGNLDPATGIAVFSLLRELQSERGFALVVATHSARLASGCNRILRLVDGLLRPLGESETADYFAGTR